MLESVSCIEQNGEFSFLLPDGLRFWGQVCNSRGEPVKDHGGQQVLAATPEDYERTRNMKAVSAKMKELVKEADKKEKAERAKRKEKKQSTRAESVA